MEHSTDISPQNVLMQLNDDSSLKNIEDQESQEPSVPVITGDTTIYKSQPTILELSGHPILTDFGQMRLVEGRTNQDWWMPNLYRAPEVVLQFPWGFAVDIWSIGVMVSPKRTNPSASQTKRLTGILNIDARALRRQKPLRPDRSCP